jgi:hypothetical protein
MNKTQTVITRGTLVVLWLAAGLLISARAAQAQAPGCAVWSHAENRCLQQAPAQAAIAACTVWSHAEQRCLAPEDPAEATARILDKIHAERDAVLERARQAQVLATPIAPQLERFREGRAVSPARQPEKPVTIATKCATDWPTDFKMQAFCRTQEAEAAGKLATRHQGATMQTGAGATIRAKCATDWPNNFKMANFCEEQQLKGLASLR